MMNISELLETCKSNNDKIMMYLQYLNIADSHFQISVGDLSWKVNISDKNIHRNLKKLELRGLIKREINLEGKDRTNYISLTDLGRDFVPKTNQKETIIKKTKPKKSVSEIENEKELDERYKKLEKELQDMIENNNNKVDQPIIKDTVLTDSKSIPDDIINVIEWMTKQMRKRYHSDKSDKWYSESAKLHIERVEMWLKQTKN